jgi:hypothetical protein
MHCSRSTSTECTASISYNCCLQLVCLCRSRAVSLKPHGRRQRYWVPCCWLCVQAGQGTQGRGGKCHVRQLPCACTGGSIRGGHGGIGCDSSLNKAVVGCVS